MVSFFRTPTICVRKLLTFSTDSGSEETATKDVPSDSIGNDLLGRA